MEREFGSSASSVWLWGDSAPEKYMEALEYPFDDRHVAVHTVWTSIIDKVQDIIYRENGGRIDTTKFFVRNAVAQRDDWKDKQNMKEETAMFAETLENEKLKKECKVIFTFGWNAYCFAKSCENAPYTFNNYISKKEPSATFKLGSECKERVENFNQNSVNIVPLLHVSISRSRDFLKSHKEFCEGLGIKKDNCSYFVETSRLIARLFLNHFKNADIWVK